MSLFPRTFITHDPSTSFTPLFRLLDDFDNYNRNSGSGQHKHHQHHQHGHALKTFAPKFDLKELPNHYELHGELPGIEQKDVEIEFTDEQTLSIRGRTEHSYTSGKAPSGFIEGEKSSGAITEKGESHGKEPRKATVEDEDKTENENVANNSNTQVTRTTENKHVSKHAEPEAKYWVSERSVGEFSRSFGFPVRVDQENVTASMKNGILEIIVPKAKMSDARKKILIS